MSGSCQDSPFSARRRNASIAALVLLALIALALRFALNEASDPVVELSAPAPFEHGTPIPTPPSDFPTRPMLDESLLASPSRSSPSADPFTSFSDWLHRYGAADITQRAQLIKEGVGLATKRRVALRARIETDPRDALSRAIPYSARRNLPREVAEHLEESISAEGDVMNVIGRPVVDGDKPMREVVVQLSNGRMLKAHPYGRRAEELDPRNMGRKAGILRKVSIHGIAIDNAMAVDDNPVRVLEPEEVADLKAAGAIAEFTCPVSGKAIRGASDARAVSVAGRSFYVCSGGHIMALNEELIAAEGGTGGGSGESPKATDPGHAIGIKRLLYIRAVFPDNGSVPATEETVYKTIKDTNDFFMENSYGRCSLVGTVTPPVVLPRSEAWYKINDNYHGVFLDAAEIALKMGYDRAQFDFVAVRYNGGPGGFSGAAVVGGRVCWMKTDGAGVAVHEFGHNMGLMHANYWAINPETSAIGAGGNQEYGDDYDCMGSANNGNPFNTCHKNLIDWLPGNFVTQVRASGTYRIYQHDVPSLDHNNSYALKIVKDLSRAYWAEFRNRHNDWTKNGVQLRWGPWNQSNGGSQLLDTTPGSAEGKRDAAITIGRTFSDTESGIHITPIGKSGTTPEAIDVVVNLGQFPGNRAPTLATSASSTTVAANTAVTLTATAADPDGDALAYFWSFGDKSFSTDNAPTQSKTFKYSGYYTVECIVSDMKGQTAYKSLQVTVGTPSTFRVSGEVAEASTGAKLSRAVVIATLDKDKRDVYTDDLGRYTLTGLAAGTWSVKALLDGYTFSSTSVTVGPDQTANFAGTALPTALLSVIDGSFAEPSNTAIVRFARTGSTSAPLNLKFAEKLYGEHARIGTDFTFSPSLNTDSNGAKTFVIPAGSSFVDLTLVPLSDTNKEGAKYVRWQLQPNAAYKLGNSSIEIILADDDTSLPVAKIELLNDMVRENSTESLQYRISRTGSTAGSLTVKLRKLNTTLPTVDVSDTTPIPTSVTIPAGQASIILNIAPVDDNLVEGVESVCLDIDADITQYFNYWSGYLRGNILDDETPTVTMSATDSSASEAGDTGTFIVTRNDANLADPLTVKYAIGGTALHGTDYRALSGTVTIPGGERRAAIVIEPHEDSIGELAQTVVLSLSSGPEYTVGSPSSGTVTIADNDLPYVQLEVVDGISDESGAKGTIQVRRPKTGAPLTVYYTVSGTASAGTDYVALGGSVAFASGEASKDIVITPVADSLEEGSETVVITLTPDASYTIADAPGGTVYIHDALQRVNVVANAYYFYEYSSTPSEFYLTRSATTNAITVRYSLTGTAVNGIDYQTLPGTVSFAAGQASVSIPVSRIADTLAEGYETVVLTLEPGTGYSVGHLRSATLGLVDDEIPAPAVQFASAASSVSEGAGTATVSLTLSAAQSSPVTVKVDTATGTTATGTGVDFTFPTTLVTFSPGQTSKTVTVVNHEDAFTEGPEQIALRIYDASNAKLGSTQNHTLTINDNDAPPALPAVAFAAVAYSGAENVSPAELLVALSRPSSSTVSVGYAVQSGGTATGGGVDYTLASGTLTFAPGETAKAITAAIVDDSAVESAETFTVQLSAPSGATLSANAAATYTILDNDTAMPGSVSVAATDASAAENNSANKATFTFTRAGSTSSAITVNYSIGGTATLGADYSVSGTLNKAAIAAGQSSATVQITGVNDSALEGPETVILTVTAGNGYSVGSPSSATVTIVDDERANTPPTISDVANQSIVENGLTPAIPFTIADAETSAAALTVSGSSNNPALVPNAGIIIGGSGANRTVAVKPAANTNGTATITLTVSDGSASATDTFVVTVTAANKAPAFASQPTATPNPARVSASITFSASASDPDADVLTYAWTFGDGTTGTGASASHAYTAAGTYAASVAVSDGKGGSTSASVSVVVEENVVPPAVDVKVNFQPAGAPIPNGYVADAGALFGNRGNGYSYGWTLDLAAESRDRNSPVSPDQRYDTLIHTQKKIITAPVWELVVPNGRYRVRVVCGDPSYFDSVYAVAVEGALAVSATPTSTQRWAEGTVTVEVEDGRLTIADAAGSVNNKLCFVEVTAVAAQAAAFGAEPAPEEEPSMNPLKVLAASAVANLARNGGDGLKIKVELPGLPSDFNAAGQSVGVDAGGATVEWTLDTRGKGKLAARTGNANGICALTKNRKNGVWTATITLARGSFSAVWQDGVLKPGDETALYAVPLAIRVGGRTFGGSSKALIAVKSAKK